MNEIQQQKYMVALEKAIEHGGICLSQEYINNRTMMLWQCSQGHTPWEASFKNIVNNGQWCKKCALANQADKQRNPQGLQLAKQHALSKSGLCLSTEYNNTKTKLLWQCAEKHQPWEATFEKVIKSGRWCPHCANENKRFIRLLDDGLQQAHDCAAERGGFCLSVEYKGSTKKMIWQCGAGHEPWLSTLNRVKDCGNWCPHCAKNNVSEKRTRLIFETFFGISFPSAKPEWNINPLKLLRVSGKKTKTYDRANLLELDGYCKEFNIAFEYDGPHHFDLTSYSGKERKPYELTYQKFKDEQKRKNCRRQGITLINIPHIDEKSRTKFKLFLDNVVSACERAGLTMTFTADQLIKLEQDFYAI